MKIINLTTPLTQEKINHLKAGDVVSISGVIYSGRDAAHKRLYECILNNEPLPIELQDQVIYYVGPCPPKPGMIIGSAGPTTSSRMDKYTPSLLDSGLKGMIGKGQRSQEVINSMIKNKAVYFAAVGGAGALISKHIKKIQVIAYPELGTEAIHKFKVENFQVIVAIDLFGNNLYNFTLS